MNKISIPEELKKDWQWDHRSWEGGYKTEGVHTYEGCLTWYTDYYPGWAGGGACQQSFEDFFDNGPHIKSVPQEILDDIERTLLPLRNKLKKGK
jgi:hypothetical protein